MSTARNATSAVANSVCFGEGIIAEYVARYFAVVAVAKRFLGKIWDLVVTMSYFVTFVSKYQLI